MYIDNINLFYGTTTGISEVGNISVELFPNPANDMTVIQINSPVPAIHALNLLTCLASASTVLKQNQIQPYR
jgi:hypothetical protein